MKLVNGDQVVQTHNNARRTKQLIELTVPADASNGGYAVRQLLGQDPDIGAKSVVMLEVVLTQQQIERLKNITEDELRDIRNGVNPAMIYGVRVYDSEPMSMEELVTGKKWPRWFTPSHNMKDATGTEIICFRRDSEHSGETFCIGGKSYTWHEWKGEDLQLEEITEQEAQAIIAHSVKPTGEFLGCIQWFQHSDPNVIVQRKSQDRCAYFDRSIMTSDILWDHHMSQWVKSGQWTEITQQEAERRIEQNRAQAMQALRNLAQQQGIDPAAMDANEIADAIIAVNLQQTVECSFMQLPADRDMVIKPDGKSLGCGNDDCNLAGKTPDPKSPFLSIPCRGCGDDAMSHMLKLHKVLTPGVWLYLTTLDGMLQLMIVDNDVELSAELPAVCLSSQTHFKTPIEWREPVLPKDYGKTVWWHDVEALTHPTHQSGRLVGASDSGSVFVIDPHDKAVAAGRSVYKKKRLVFIVDQPTEGF